MVSLAIAGGTLLGGLAFRRFAPQALRFIGRRGVRAFGSRQIQRAGAGALAVGVAGGLATEALVRGVESVRQGRPEEMAQVLAPRRPSSQVPVRRGQIVTPGPVPVEFVKTWQACAALFAIDDQGVRWVWRPRLGIWKRIRNTRNIVISGKDLRRAKRLVRISKRLNAMRKQLR